jgi:drug/metabolite transporter (DMT)-like permease
VAAKAMFNQSLDPLVVVKIRMTLSFFLMVGGLYLWRPKLLVIPKRDILYFMTLGIAGMAMLQSTYYLTISLTNVATALFLQYLSPVLMAIYAGVWEKVRLGSRRIIAVMIATAGGFLIMLGSGGVGGFNVIGTACGIVSAFFMAFSTIYSRRGITEHHPFTAVTYMFGFGALAYWIIMPNAMLPSPFTIEQAAMLAYVVVFSTVVPFLLYFAAVGILSPTSVGVTACLEPVIGAIAAYFLLHETMSVPQLMGGALVIGAVILLQTAGAEVKTPQPSPSADAGGDD